MKTNKNQRDVEIISEIHPQHYGSINEIKRMIIQSKIGGADIVKVQLYDSKKLWGDSKRLYLDISKDELAEINEFCKLQGIELSASIFDLKRVDWCSELNFKTYKIASRSVEDKELCEKILSLNELTVVLISHNPKVIAKCDSVLILKNRVHERYLDKQMRKHPKIEKKN